jgi:hypothetical protein
MNDSKPSDPAERSGLMRLFYRNWRPTRLGLWVNRLMSWWSGLGMPPKFQAALEVRGWGSWIWRLPEDTSSGKRHLPPHSMDARLRQSAKRDSFSTRKNRTLPLSMRRTIRKLRSGIVGNVITPNGSEYEAARLVFNRAFDRRPAVIVR